MWVLEQAHRLSRSFLFGGEVDVDPTAEAGSGEQAGQHEQGQDEQEQEQEGHGRGALQERGDDGRVGGESVQEQEDLQQSTDGASTAKTSSSPAPEKYQGQDAQTPTPEPPARPPTPRQPPQSDAVDIVLDLTTKEQAPPRADAREPGYLREAPKGPDVGWDVGWDVVTWPPPPPPPPPPPKPPRTATPWPPITMNDEQDDDDQEDQVMSSRLATGGSDSDDEGGMDSSSGGSSGGSEDGGEDGGEEADDADALLPPRRDGVGTSRVSALRQVLLAQASPFSLRATMWRGPDYEPLSVREGPGDAGTGPATPDADGDRARKALTLPSPPALIDGVVPSRDLLLQHQREHPELVDDLKTFLGIKPPPTTGQALETTLETVESVELADPYHTKPQPSPAPQPACAAEAMSALDGQGPGAVSQHQPGAAFSAPDCVAAGVALAVAGPSRHDQNNAVDVDPRHGGHGPGCAHGSDAASVEDKCLECCVYYGVMCCQCTIS